MAEYSADSQKADQQNAYYMENAREAQRAARDTYVHQQVRLREERAASSQEAFENSVKAMQARGSSYVSAGEAGVAGLSVDALIGSIFAKEGREQESVDTQYQMNRDNIRAEMDKTQSNAQARINSVQRANAPSAAAFLIKGLSGAIGGMKGMTV